MEEAFLLFACRVNPGCLLIAVRHAYEGPSGVQQVLRPETYFTERPRLFPPTPPARQFLGNWAILPDSPPHGEH
jgi:hypothetical protein